ncbi:hypothetical protein AYO20_04102 [Fonsecaea nubica]|uniref:Protein kinase domain-containing protein n=1 Tax=Fonsecaea nubica TaxID=856822 RepID=A0A178D415_9EURO|nr:hypothetical protein AYO20_04102 [Fonsecaea nubica]OAL36486.1 hypothetical protein AYO20_04102 [Fonsecaea nubica]
MSVAGSLPLSCRARTCPLIVDCATTIPLPSIDGPIHARLINFEQAFLQTDQPPLAKVRTPLVFRVPETLLDTTWDLRIDIGSLGCTIFEFVTGQPSFDNFMPRKAPLVLEWIAKNPLGG